MKKKVMALLLGVCMLASLLAVPAAAADLSGHWSAKSVQRWVDAGVLEVDDSYNPDTDMTRGEFAKLLADLMGYTETAPASTFTDIAESEYASAILKLAAAGVMEGDGKGHATPNSSITRQEMAKLICVAFNIAPSTGNVTFADAGGISSWAKGYVGALAQRGMLKGVGNNNVAPWGNITHGQMAALLDQSITEYVTESTEITGTVPGFVVVAKNATVTVKDASLSESLIVGPSAQGATVVLSGSTSAKDVVVTADNVTVTVEKDASVNEVAVEADRASVRVSGTVDTVAVSGDNASVTANSGASVGSVATSGDNVSITANSGAAISSVTTTGDGSTTVSGSGKVENVVATGSGSTKVTATGANVENNGTGTVTAGNKTVASGTSAEVAKPSYTPTYYPPVTETPEDPDHCTGNEDKPGDNETTDPGTNCPGEQEVMGEEQGTEPNEDD